MQRLTFAGLTFGLGQKYLLGKFNPNAGNVTDKTETYTDCYDIVHSNYSDRHIPLDGYIFASSEHEMYELRKRLVQVCNGKRKDTLKYTVGNDKYQSDARASLPEFGERIKNCLPFTIYFDLYNFYWYSDEEHIINAFERVNKLKTQFTLPCIFTDRINRKTVINRGDINAPMIIEIDCQSNNNVVMMSENKAGIEVINHRTGQKISLEYNLVVGEKIIIDTKNVTVISTINGNILKYVTADSVLDMTLLEGENDIETISYDASKPILVFIKFRDLFVGV